MAMGLTYCWDYSGTRHVSKQQEEAVRHLPLTSHRVENRKDHWRKKHEDLPNDLNSMTFRNLPPPHLLYVRTVRIPFSDPFESKPLFSKIFAKSNALVAIDPGKSSKYALINAMLFTSNSHLRYLS